MGSINIINNFLDNTLFFEFKKILMSENINWFWRNHTTSEDNYFFNHCFYTDDRIQSDFFEPFILPILKKLNYTKIIEIKANLVLKKDKIFQTDFYTDNKLNCNTALFYINNCNGYTILSRKEQIKVPCEENKILIFNSQIEHAGVSQTDYERKIIVNFNYS
jgi:hypothetical protein